MNAETPSGSVEVSYVVASYNHARFITRTLDSILTEASSGGEIIILDDGSSDGSCEVIRNWIAAHSEAAVRFSHRPNKGVCATFNELFAMARGEFIRLCSSDDELIAGSTQKMVTHLRDHSDLAAVFTDGVVIDQSGQKIHESIIEFEGGRVRRYEKDVSAAVISDWAISGPVILMRSSLFKDEKPYDESLSVEDWYMYSKLAAQGIIGFLPISGVRYRIHGRNVSKTQDVDKKIRNLSSHLAGATNNLGRLSGGLRLLMLSEIALLKAKLCYLRRQFVRGIPQLLNHYVQGWLGRLVRAFERKAA
jgi:glycosyltransferase involved in cell wall biosynthesis